MGWLPRRTAHKSRRASALSLSLLLALVAPATLLSPVEAAESSYTPVPRWGHASTLLSNAMLVHGGKTAGTGGYTYTSAPNTGDLLSLDLTQPFSVSSPPWKLVSLSDPLSASAMAPPTPSVAFHTLTPLSATELLLFGGDSTGSEPVQTNNDSAWLLSLTTTSSSSSSLQPNWTQPVTGWDGEPIRRMGHTAVASNGRVWYMGGEKDDGSGAVWADTYSFDTRSASALASASFQTNAPAPSPIWGHTATLFSTGIVYVLGGVGPTGLNSLDTVKVYDTLTDTWTSVPCSGSAPSPRRNHVAVALPGDKILVHGGADQAGTTAYADMAVLDTKSNPPTWSTLNASAGGPGPGPVYSHSAVALGQRVVFAFGYANSVPAPADVFVYDAQSDAWSATYVPDLSSSAGDAGGDNGSGSSSGSPAGVPTPTGTPSGTSGELPGGTASSFSGSGDSTSTGAKAGATVGAIVALGLVAGAGYFYYTRHLHRGGARDGAFGWKRSGGEGAVGLIGGRGGVDGGEGREDDYDYGSTLEKGLGMAALGIGRPRGVKRPWATSNAAAASPVGRGRGSPKVMRERLVAFLPVAAGAFRAGGSKQPRFDMLADEDEDENDEDGVHGAWGRRTASGRGRVATSLDLDEQRDAEAMGGWRSGRLGSTDGGGGGGEHVYGRLNGYDDPFDDQHDGGSSVVGFDTSRDEAVYAAAEASGSSVQLVPAAAVGWRGGSKRKAPPAFEEGDDDDDASAASFSSEAALSETEGRRTPAPALVPTEESGTSTTLTVGQTSVGSEGGGSPLKRSPGFVSFSDASPKIRRSSSSFSSNLAATAILSPPPLGTSISTPNPMIRRSGTWWDRFLSSSFLERTTSGQLRPGPRASEPIRDPAPAPTLAPVAEAGSSPSSPEDSQFSNPHPHAEDFARSSREDGFRDGRSTAEKDDVARRRSGGGGGDPLRSAGAHGRSLSSLQSARTATSSQLEDRVRTMDVVQRMPTASSSIGSSHVIESPDCESFDEHDHAMEDGRWNASGRPLLSSPSTVASPPSPSVYAPTPSITALSPSSTSAGLLRSPEGEVVWDGPAMMSSLAALMEEPAEMSPVDVDGGDPAEPTFSPTNLWSWSRPKDGGEAAGFDGPTSTVSSPARPRPTSTSTGRRVLDRVREIEQRQSLLSDRAYPSPESAYAASPSRLALARVSIPTSPSSSPASSRPAFSALASPASAVGVSSPSSGVGMESTLSPATRSKYRHGLVPKPTLFVANPDERRSSSTST